MAYFAALLVTAIATIINRSLLTWLDHSNLIMIYLLGIVYVASNFGRGPSILASLASVACFDYFCIPPRYTFAVEDTQYVLTFLIMLSIALLITTLTGQIREQVEIAKDREKRTSALHAMSRELSVTRGRDPLIEVSLKHIRTFFNAMVGIHIPDESGHLCQFSAGQEKLPVKTQENEAAQWVFHNHKTTGLGLEPFAQAGSIYLPLIASEGTVGVLQVAPSQANALVRNDEMEMLETFANQTAMCIEVANLAETAQKANFQIEKERLRNTLLGSVSHDLRTPLATITGASSTLLEENATLDATKQQELAQIIFEESERLNSLVNKLLDMTKLESGSLQLHKAWQPLEEVIGATLVRMEKQLNRRPLTIDLPDNLPLVEIDEILFQLVIQNLIENAIKYTNTESPLEIKAKADSKELILELADRGPGIVAGEESEIFTKFFRSPSTKTSGGSGLGLAICRTIVMAHDGTITAQNRPDGGAVFSIKLPLTGNPPQPLPEIETE